MRAPAFTPCTVSCCDDQFTNRVITVVDGVDDSVAFGFNSCDATCTPPPGANVEFCVDIGCIMPTGTLGGGWEVQGYRGEIIAGTDNEATHPF